MEQWLIGFVKIDALIVLILCANSIQREREREREREIEREIELTTVNVTGIYKTSTFLLGRPQKTQALIISKYLKSFQETFPCFSESLVLRRRCHSFQLNIFQFC